jgi:CelD/BcsL family acetyltransferase involved in cellulose biosynthesis
VTPPVLNVSVLPGEFPEPALVGQWRELLDDAVFATPFQTPAWTRAWWWHFGGRRTPHWLAFHQGRDLVGLYPLYVTIGPWKSVRAIGTGHSDYLHPLVRTGYQQSVSAALIDHLAGLQDVDLADLHQMREGVSPAAGDFEPEVQAHCLVLDLPTSYDGYLKGLSKSLRFDCRRLGKEPFVGGKAKIESVDEGNLAQATEAFFGLHAKRWRTRMQPGAFATNRVKRFHREAVAALERDGHLRMSVLTLDGEPAGVIYAMQVGGARFFYQCGYDPEHKALSPGTLLVADCINKAIEEGCARFDFMRGDEAYKRRWSPQHSHRNLRYILPLNSGLGSVGRAVNHAGSKLEEKVRARLEGRGLF